MRYEGFESLCRDFFEGGVRGGAEEVLCRGLFVEVVRGDEGDEGGEGKEKEKKKKRRHVRSERISKNVSVSYTDKRLILSSHL